ncbi:ribonuclease G [Bifidobacterium ramosum]|uniref:Ribonuclease E n=1 Tax=Bifidobacterium ramosum TaxID=1798158 RepID=A0A6L4X0B6_9BIFI|nr:ribonuclease G [Bifidobacterium ramosum]
MPSVNNEGLGEAAAADNTVSTTASSAADSSGQGQPASSAASLPSVSASQPVAPRRRRGGRRVVRGAGAAGAAVELTVQEHAAPLFEEPRVADIVAAEAASAAKDSRTSSGDGDAQSSDDDSSVRRPSRSVGRRRAAAHTADDGDASDSRADAPRANGRRDDHDGDDRDDDQPSRRVRSRRRRASFDDEYDARYDEPQSGRSRRRGPVSDYEPFDTRDDRDDRGDAASRRRTRSRDDASGDERAFDAVDLLPIDHDASPRGVRPMTSLLFQEPVLPAVAAHADRSRAADRDDETADAGHDDDRDAGASRSSRRSRRRRGASTDVTVASDAAVDRPSDDDRAGRSADDADAQDDTAASGRSRRSRRLNAQERRAAAEVEQIEEDLEFDDITYAPITEEDLSEGPTRSRRRRRRGGRDAARDTERDTTESDESSSADADDRDRDADTPRRRRDDEDNEGEESTVTRRRRRRRSKSGEEAVEELAPRRSRKQQYIDEITDIEGSTRLEAKKQRRRDNRRERSRQSQLMEQDFLARRENVERLMVVRERGRHTQISVIEDNVLVEHYVSDIQEVATVGNVYLGRVQNVLPSMEAAFVDIGQARNGVLYAGEVNWDAARLDGQPRRIELAFKSGDPVLVQVTKDPIGHKGARLTSQVTLAGRFLVLVPSGGMTGVSRKLSDRERSRLKNIVSKIAPKDMGVIIRTAAEGASEEAIVKDLESLVRQWERITAKRDEFLHGRRPKLLQGEPDVAIRVVRDIFNDDFKQMIVEGDKVYERIEEYLETMAPDLRDKLVKWDPAEHNGKDVFDKWQIDSQLRKGMERQVYLPSGGSIVIDRTEAMTTIDVNTGRFIGRGKSLEETVTRCNLEAAEEIARQLRLRDIGGMVMIDFVDMVMPANRDLVLRRLVECLARDRTKHQVAEVTSLGLVQMTRKRIGQGLVEAFSEECPTCKGRGFILHDEPTVNADYDDPYALKGGDPFIKTNKHGRGTDVQVPQGSSPDVKAKLAAIAAAAVAANNADGEE